MPVGAPTSLVVCKEIGGEALNRTAAARFQEDSTFEHYPTAAGVCSNSFAQRSAFRDFHAPL